MTAPLVVLAAFAIFFGAVGFPPDDGEFHEFLSPVFYSSEGHGEEAEVAGIASDSSLALNASLAEEERAESKFGHPTITDQVKLNFGIISTIVALSGIVIAYLVFMARRIDAVQFAADHPLLHRFLYNKWYFDEVYDALIVRKLRSLAMFLWQQVDVGIIDGLILGTVGAVTWTSSRLRRVQTGLVGNYALAIALGMVVIVGVYFAAFSDLFR
jgi:NADH-quinone oxidoreductase subunit L